MSSFRSDKCTTEQLQKHKKDVLAWLASIRIDTQKIKYRTLKSYNGDFRIYTGHMKVPNIKSSFRREKETLDETGNVIGYVGTRGRHTQIIPTYIVINRDEFEELKKEWNNPDTYNVDVEELKKLL